MNLVRENNKKGYDKVPMFTAKDYITIAISLAALVASLSSIYFTLFRQIDDVRVVLTGHPPIAVHTPIVIDGKTVRRLREILFKEREMTFINSGNRTVSLSELKLTTSFLLKVEELRDIKCELDFSESGPSTQSFTLKPGDALSKVVEPPRLSRKFDDRSKDAPGFLSCLELAVSTPDKYYYLSIPLALSLFSAPDEQVPTHIVHLFNLRMAIPVLKDEYQREKRYEM
jgi:hypothetical protein